MEYSLATKMNEEQRKWISLEDCELKEAMYKGPCIM